MRSRGYFGFWLWGFWSGLITQNFIVHVLGWHRFTLITIVTILGLAIFARDLYVAKPKTGTKTAL